MAKFTSDILYISIDQLGGTEFSVEATADSVEQIKKREFNISIEDDGNELEEGQVQVKAQDGQWVELFQYIKFNLDISDWLVACQEEESEEDE